MDTTDLLYQMTVSLKWFLPIFVALPLHWYYRRLSVHTALYRMFCLKDDQVEPFKAKARELGFGYMDTEAEKNPASSLSSPGVEAGRFSYRVDQENQARGWFYDFGVMGTLVGLIIALSIGGESKQESISLALATTLFGLAGEWWTTRRSQPFIKLKEWADELEYSSTAGGG